MNATGLWIAAIALSITSVGLLVSRSWRWSLSLLALQYFSAFWLVLAHWPLSMSATVLVGGWMAAAALGMTHINIKDDPAVETSWPQGSLFRILATGLVLMVVSVAASSLAAWLPTNTLLALAWGALVLVSLGLLHLGMTLQPLRVIIGLLTTLLGFEIIYSIIENSVLVAGLLVVITLGLALTGCYLLVLGEQPA
ncbi:MAG TPA: hypothetical protein VGK00_09955 [Anaerolineales bacterium]|jgi:hypothetical protein